MELLDYQLLLLITPWSIAALATDGVQWATQRVAIDGLRVDTVESGWLRGVADPEDDEARHFSLELASGGVIGGSGIA